MVLGSRVDGDRRTESNGVSVYPQLSSFHGKPFAVKAFA